MPIHDSNPERRNLTVLSFFIILYYLSGAEPATAGQINIPFVSLTIKNLMPVTLAIWLSLYWFAYKYWLVNKGRFFSQLAGDISGVAGDNKAVHDFIQKIQPDPQGYYFKATGVIINKYKKLLKPNDWLIQIEIYSKRNTDMYGFTRHAGTQKPNAVSQALHTQIQTHIPVTGLSGAALKLTLVLNALVYGEAFTTYGFAYLMFYIAAAMPLVYW